MVPTIASQAWALGKQKCPMPRARAWMIINQGTLLNKKFLATFFCWYDRCSYHSNPLGLPKNINQLKFEKPNIFFVPTSWMNSHSEIVFPTTQRKPFVVYVDPSIFGKSKHVKTFGELVVAFGELLQGNTDRHEGKKTNTTNQFKIA